jgi:hypothetical protein
MWACAPAGNFFRLLSGNMGAKGIRQDGHEGSDNLPGGQNESSFPFGRVGFMSKHNRERKLLWRLGLHKKQVGRKLSGGEITRQKASLQAERAVPVMPAAPKIVEG